MSVNHPPMTYAAKDVLYGSGVFTTVAVVCGEPLFWEKHWRRLSTHAQLLSIDLAGHSEESIRKSLEMVIADHHVVNGRARITIADNSPSEIWIGADGEGATVSIITGHRREVPDHFKITTSPHLVNSTSPLAGIKSCNYLEHLIANKEAKRRGFDEAVRINERGEITSACMANIFWSKDDKLYTPSLKTGCLAGTTREYVLENLDSKEVDARIDTLHEADALFLTSAGLGVVRVAEFDGRELRGHDHPILQIGTIFNP